MRSLFGTDGIRGTVNKYPITEQFFSEFAHTIEQFFQNFLKKSSLKIAIGRDTRKSGHFLQNALIQGLSNNTTVLDCGIIPTPGISVVVNDQGCDLGLVITASHNTYTDNGLKIFNSFGEKLSILLENEIEKFFFTHPHFLPDKIANIIDFQQQAREIFISRFNGFNFHLNQQIVLDTANGATTYTSPIILKKYCSNLLIIGNNPDGENINIACGSEHIEHLVTMVQSHSPSIGIAHDGDGDRLIMIDENGQRLTGDQIIGIIAKYLKYKDLLTNNIIVVTNQSNSGLEDSLQNNNIRVIRSDIGDRNVYHDMLKHGSILGGEESGHIILRNFVNTGDAISAAILILQILSEQQLTLTQLASQIQLCPQKVLNLQIAEKVPLEKFTNLDTLLNNLKKTNIHYKRSLIRYSGTENKLRILIEADTKQDAENIGKQIYYCTIKEFEKLGIFIK